MDYQINFPNLGIFLEHVGKTLKIGSFEIAFYGICIAIGMLLGITAVCKRAEATGQKADDYIDIAIWTMIFGVIGARVYYVIFMWDMYQGDLRSILNVREGGLAIYGGIIAGAITIAVLSRLKKMDVRVMLDTCVIGLPIGQIIGRWGNFFNREAFGGYTDGLFAMQLPLSAVRSGEVTEMMASHIVNLGGVDFISVHPTFLYEGMWNCLVLLILFLMRNRTRFKGELFLLYVIGYGIGRFFIESLRTDQLYLTGTQIPVSMLVSAVAVIAALVLVVAGRVQAAKKVSE